VSYDLHITRRAWWSEEGNDIHFDEWRAYVDADSELHLDGFAIGRIPGGEAIRIEAPGLTRWAPDGETAGWFDHKGGSITVTGAGPANFAKAYAIAAALGASLQGDEGEFYDADGKIIP
jgi:hypothetical protein